METARTKASGCDCTTWIIDGMGPLQWYLVAAAWHTMCWPVGGQNLRLHPAPTSPCCSAPTGALVPPLQPHGLVQGTYSFLLVDRHGASCSQTPSPVRQRPLSSPSWDSRSSLVWFGSAHCWPDLWPSTCQRWITNRTGSQDQLHWGQEGGEVQWAILTHFPTNSLKTFDLRTKIH